MIRTLIWGIIGGIILLLLPLLFPSTYFYNLACQILIISLFAVSLNLLVGYTGMISFGHAAYYGIGAYSVGIILQKTSFSLLTALFLSVLFSAIAALIIGFFCIRLGRIYFAMLTLAFAQIVYTIVVKWTNFTGGDQGLIGGVPRPPIHLLWLSIDIGTPLHLYLFTTIFVVVSLIICKWIVDSPFGAILCAIRDNTERTYFIGIHVRTYQLIIFIIAGTFAGLSGSLMALFISGAYPDFVYWTKSAEPIFVVLIGGMKNFLGPVVGAVIFFFLEDRIKLFTDLWGLVLGVILIIFTMVTRAGIIDFLADTPVAVYFKNTLDLPSRMLRLRRTFRETKKGGQ